MVWSEIFDWGRRFGVRVTPLGMGGCALDLEKIPEADPRHDLASFGPCRGDLLVVAGPVTGKMAPILRRLWDELPEPKWTLALGPGADPWRTYAVRSDLGGIPVHVRVPGWPPTPDDLYKGLLEIQRQVAPEVPA